MGLAELFEFKVGEVVNERKKLEEIAEQIKKQCKMLGGKITEVKHSETLEFLVCSFPEPKGITRVDFDELEGKGGEFYIETEDGYHGAKVNVGDIRTRIEALGVFGNVIYDTEGYYDIKSKKTGAIFSITPKEKSKRKVIKKTKEIRYTVSSDFIHIVF